MKACLSNALSSYPYEWELTPQNSPTDPFVFEEGLLKEDLWSFGYFWSEVVRQFPTIEQLYRAIYDLHQKIETIKESFRLQAESFPEWRMEPNESRGVCGSYFLVDEEGERRFVVKPLDEDAGCIHSDGFATPFTSSPFRSNIPLYRSSMREVLAYRVAVAIGVGSIVPKTELGIFTSDQFHRFSEGIDGKELSRYFEECGPEGREKLCSVQEYVPHAKSLFEALHELEGGGLSDEEIAHRFDQTDFEDANILLWTNYDTDGHMGNFLVYPKGVDEIGNEILSLKKIDHGLAFPDKNRQLKNSLSYLPNAKRPLSAEGKAKIAAVDGEQLAKQFEQMGLESAVAALKERISILQALAKKTDITIQEIDRAMSKIGKKL